MRPDTNQHLQYNSQRKLTAEGRQPRLFRLSSEENVPYVYKHQHIFVPLCYLNMLRALQKSNKESHTNFKYNDYNDVLHLQQSSGSASMQSQNTN